ncbi:MAG: hypothetical protein LBM20_01415 [Rikenellaceae bacterium]|jgi:hypothetical protein|nr:hypothetical protein [Rikenellaceae bacterium]
MKNEFTCSATLLPARRIENPENTLKWAYTLAIAGFALTALFVALGSTGILWADTLSYYSRVTYSTDPASDGFPLLITLAFFAMSLVYLFPSYYLWESCSRLLTAFRRRDIITLRQTNGAVKAHFVYMAILLSITFGIVAFLMM